MTTEPSKSELAAELEDLRARLAEAEEVLQAIRNGEVDAVVVTGERGEQVYTLSGADRLYRQLIETMSEGAGTLSADGVILYGNVRLAEMLGRPLDQVLGTALRNHLPPADQQALDAILAQARTAPSRREINLKSSEGRLVPVYLSASRLHIEGAEMVFCLVLTDMTGQKSHERIVAAERLARLVLEQAVEAIVVCDEQGRVIRASQAAQRFCDGSPLLRPFAEVFPLRTDASDPFHLAPVLQGETLQNVDVVLDRQGRKFDLILNAGPLLSGQQILGCVVTLTDITERKQAEEALQQERELYVDLVNTQPAGIYRLRVLSGKFLSEEKWRSSKDAPYSFELISDRFCEILKLDRRALEGNPGIVNDLVFEADKEEFARKNIEANSRMIPFIWEGRLVIGEALLWVHLESHPRPLEDGDTLWTGILYDITERKRAEEALRESEKKYRLLIDTANESVFVEQDDLLKFINPMMINLMGGYSMQELMERPFPEFVHPDDRSIVVENHRRRIANEAVVPRYSFRVVTRAGLVKWVEINAALIEWQSKPATLNFLTDITERKGAEEALRQAEENSRRSLDESLLGVRVVNADGETIYANRAILDIYGYDNIEELRSTPAKKRYTLESYAEHELRKKKRVNGEDYSSEYELSIIRKMGEIRRLRVFRKEILWNGQKQFQAIYQDITEQKKTEEKLRETLSNLRNALDGIIQVISAITEKRDPYTAGHQRRVADLAGTIGREMGLTVDRTEGLRIAGIIHDIGKVSIPSEILSKPTRLTELEYLLIQSHSQVGHDILSDIEFPWPIAEIVLQHHERMDGSGYPNQLKGEEIRLEARILAISDVVEAMASHRPYRAALGIAAALEEIEKNKGILYDAEAVVTCLKLFREKDFKFKY